MSSPFDMRTPDAEELKAICGVGTTDVIVSDLSSLGVSYKPKTGEMSILMDRCCTIKASR